MTAAGFGTGIAEGEGVDQIMFATGAPIFGMSADEARLQRSGGLLDMMRHQLDQPNLMLGGAPRALVSTLEGQRTVEGWLHQAERRGVPGEGEVAAFLDLDPLRVDLGLPTVGALKSCR